MTRIAILDDWQNVARASADWAPLENRAELVFFNRPLGSPDEIVKALEGFDAILAMRERTIFSPGGSSINSSAMSASAFSNASSGRSMPEPQNICR